MRTTLTIDDDIATQVEHEVKRSGDTFKGTVNRLLRLGLTCGERHTERKPFVVEPLFFGVQAGRNYDNIEALLEELDGPGHK